MLTENYLKSTSLEAMLYDDIALLALSSVLGHSGSMWQGQLTCLTPEAHRPGTCVAGIYLRCFATDSSCAAAIGLSTAREWCLLRLITARTG
jgi:hypothetical protein